jgi:hypothetical protein
VETETEDGKSLSRQFRPLVASEATQNDTPLRSNARQDCTGEEE